MSETTRESNSGSAHFGDKTAAYLKKLTRESVEKHTNTSVLFFEIDYEKSKRNFYGETIIKVWKNSIGIQISGTINIGEGTDIVIEDIPNQITKLIFSCYVSHLKELNVEPKIGDYFSTKNRIYLIYEKSILDANKAAIATDREALWISYTCVAADDEQLTIPGGKNNIGTKNQIEGTSQF
jgi:hypothetical protein